MRLDWARAPAWVSDMDGMLDVCADVPEFGPVDAGRARRVREPAEWSKGDQR